MAAPRKPKKKTKKIARAILRTDELEPVVGITAPRLAKVFDEESFGAFAVLETGDGQFIQTASEWEPGAVSAAFLRKNESDPWRVEYRESAAEPMYRLKGHHRLAQVKIAFLSWLAGDDGWRKAHTWKVLEL